MCDSYDKTDKAGIMDGWCGSIFFFMSVFSLYMYNIVASKHNNCTINIVLYKKLDEL